MTLSNEEFLFGWKNGVLNFLIEIVHCFFLLWCSDGQVGRGDWTLRMKEGNSEVWDVMSRERMGQFWLRIVYWECLKKLVQNLRKIFQEKLYLFYHFNSLTEFNLFWKFFIIFHLSFLQLQLKRLFFFCAPKNDEIPHQSHVRFPHNKTKKFLSKRKAQLPFRLPLSTRKKKTNQASAHVEH